MSVILFAALCVAYDSGNSCTDRQVFPAGMWEGPGAVVECQAELQASTDRLRTEDLEKHFVLYCEQHDE